MKREKRQKIVQRIQAQRLVKKFLNKYKGEVKKAKNAAKKSLEQTKKDVEVQENHERKLSEVNQIYFEVWRNLQSIIKQKYPMANLDPNFFIDYVIWE